MMGKRCSPHRDGSKTFTGEEGGTVMVISDGGRLGRRKAGRDSSLRRGLGP
jgi:hypothetical protein